MRRRAKKTYISMLTEAPSKSSTRLVIDSVVKKTVRHAANIISRTISRMSKKEILCLIFRCVTVSNEEVFLD